MDYKTQQEQFLNENQNKPGVFKTETGLQYEILKEGSGKQANSSSVVKVDYKGTFINGKEFDSSYSRGVSASFPLKNVILGWQEGIPLMKEGAVYRFFIPSSIAYGSRDVYEIPGYSTLIFEVELHEVID